jgi:hypothetical protein
MTHPNKRRVFLWNTVQREGMQQGGMAEAASSSLHVAASSRGEGVCVGMRRHFATNISFAFNARQQFGLSAVNAREKQARHNRAIIV